MNTNGSKMTNLIEIIKNVADEKTQTQLLRALANTNGMGLMRTCLRIVDQKSKETPNEKTIDSFNETAGGNNVNDVLDKNRVGIKDLGKEGGYTRLDTNSDATDESIADHGHTPRRPLHDIAHDYALMYIAAADDLRGRKLTEFDHPMDLNMMFDFSVKTLSSNFAGDNAAIAAALGTSVDISRKINAKTSETEERLRSLRQETLALFHDHAKAIDEPSWGPLYEMRPDTVYNLLMKLADAMLKERIRLINNAGHCMHLFATDALIKADVAHQLVLEGERLITANKTEIGALIAQGATRLNGLTKSYSVVVDRRTGERAEYSCETEYANYLAYTVYPDGEKKIA